MLLVRSATPCRTPLCHALFCCHQVGDELSAITAHTGYDGKDTIAYRSTKVSDDGGAV